MICNISNCTAAVRWHNTLCQSHARQVPEVIQMDLYRIAALLVKAKRVTIIREYGRRYRRVLGEAVAAVSGQ